MGDVQQNSERDSATISLAVLRSIDSRLAALEAGVEAALEIAPFVARGRIRKVMDDARSQAERRDAG